MLSELGQELLLEDAQRYVLLSSLYQDMHAHPTSKHYCKFCDAICSRCVASYNSFIDSLHSFTVLMFYDYIVTLPLEISHIWKSRSLVIKVLFFTNRYSSLFATFLSTFPLFYKPATNVVCASPLLQRAYISWCFRSMSDHVLFLPSFMTMK